MLHPGIDALSVVHGLDAEGFVRIRGDNEFLETNHNSQLFNAYVSVNAIFTLKERFCWKI